MNTPRFFIHPKTFPGFVFFFPEQVIHSEVPRHADQHGDLGAAAAAELRELPAAPLLPHLRRPRRGPRFRRVSADSHVGAGSRDPRGAVLGRPRPVLFLGNTRSLLV